MGNLPVWIIALIALSFFWVVLWDYLRCKADRLSPLRSVYYDRIGNLGWLVITGTGLILFAGRSSLSVLVGCLVFFGVVWKTTFDYLWYKASDPWRSKAQRYESYSLLGCLLAFVIATVISIACAISSGFISWSRELLPY